MNRNTTTAGRFTYGRKLINAGISGIRSGHQDLGPRSVSNSMVAAVPGSLKLAAIGACLGLLPGLTDAAPLTRFHCDCLSRGGQCYRIVRWTYLEDPESHIESGPLGSTRGAQGQRRALA